MANCGCNPCSSKMPETKKSCKPFSLCVGNKSLHYDGNCLYVTKRKFQIPDGTYTSLTFADGCIVGVGQAPIPVYTPQACCDGATSNPPPVEVTSLTVAPSASNLAKIENNQLTVDPVWKDSTSVNVSGNGSPDKPWTAKVKLSPRNNRISQQADGLKVELEFESTDKVKLTGLGTVDNPYKFDLGDIQATLPEINVTEFEGNGFTITKTGLWKVRHGLEVVTNLEFSSEAFQVVNSGLTTQVIVDEARLRNGRGINASSVFTGTGNIPSPLDIDDDALLTRVLSKPALVQKLKTALGL